MNYVSMHNHHQALSGCDTMSYYAITIFTEWDMPSTTVALIFQVFS